MGQQINQGPHLFETPFFKDTLHLRSQLVSPCLKPSTMLPWISNQKNIIQISKKNIFLIGGEDDLVIGGKEGITNMGKILKDDNNLNINLVKKLPHHNPESAGLYVKKVFSENLLI